jgi:hypothetical protein
LSKRRHAISLANRIGAVTGPLSAVVASLTQSIQWCVERHPPRRQSTYGVLLTQAGAVLQAVRHLVPLPA